MYKIKIAKIMYNLIKDYSDMFEKIDFKDERYAELTEQTFYNLYEVIMRELGVSRTQCANLCYENDMIEAGKFRRDIVPEEFYPYYIKKLIIDKNKISIDELKNIRIRNYIIDNDLFDFNFIIFNEVVEKYLQNIIIILEEE